jgi:hypothetical protein
MRIETLNCTAISGACSHQPCGATAKSLTRTRHAAVRHDAIDEPAAADDERLRFTPCPINRMQVILVQLQSALANRRRIPIKGVIHRPSAHWSSWLYLGWISALLVHHPVLRRALYAQPIPEKISEKCHAPEKTQTRGILSQLGLCTANEGRGVGGGGKHRPQGVLRVHRSSLVNLMHLSY